MVPIHQTLAFVAAGSIVAAEVVSMINSVALERPEVFDLVVEHNGRAIITAAGESGRCLAEGLCRPRPGPGRSLLWWWRL
mgnify:CR=1 FL=1